MTLPVAERAADKLLMQDLVGQVRRPMRRSVGLLAIVLLTQTIFLVAVGSVYAIPFFMVGLTSWIAFTLGVFGNTGGLPVFSVFMLQHGIVYGFPLAVQNKFLEKYESGVILQSAIAYSLFVVVAIATWQIGKSVMQSGKSKWILFEQGTLHLTHRFIARTGIALLTLPVLLQLSLITNLYWQVTGSSGAGLLSICKAIAGACQVSGAFLGAYATTRVASHRVAFWSVWICLFMLLMATVLLSSAIGLVIGTLGGLYLGTKKMAWLPTIAIFFVLAFLNVGKFEMRSRYWSDQQGMQVSLVQLPGFFAEWVEASTSKLTKQNDEFAKDEEKGQALTDRIIGFDNLAYVVRALTGLGYSPVNGAGYAVLPKVFVPRIFWKDKPRSHEGQMLLNLHFDRQRNQSETEKTYIAWGLLPEAIGNFGIWIGAIGFGLVAGFVTGFIETWSTRKSLLSLEGVGACILMIYAFVSFEMAAGVLAGTLFQTGIVIVAGGFVLMQFRKRSRPKLQSRRPTAMPARG